MVTKGLLVRFESRDRSDDDVRKLLLAAKPLVEREPATTVWFAIRFGRGEFGVFDAFADEAGRKAHLQGAMASALMSAKDSLLAGMPTITQLDVVERRLPPDDLQDITKGLLLTFRISEGHEADAAAFLREAHQLVEEEVRTRAWFALQFDAQHFGIFDVFADASARFAHLAGQVPRLFSKHALSLLGGVPALQMLDVVAVTSRSPPVD